MVSFVAGLSHKLAATFSFRFIYLIAGQFILTSLYGIFKGGLAMEGVKNGNPTALAGVTLILFLVLCYEAYCFYLFKTKKNDKSSRPTMYFCLAQSLVQVASALVFVLACLSSPILNETDGLAQPGFAAYTAENFNCPMFVTAGGLIVVWQLMQNYISLYQYMLISNVAAADDESEIMGFKKNSVIVSATCASLLTVYGLLSLTTVYEGFCDVLNPAPILGLPQVYVAVFPSVDAIFGVIQYILIRRVRTRLSNLDVSKSSDKTTQTLLNVERFSVRVAIISMLTAFTSLGCLGSFTGGAANCLTCIFMFLSAACRRIPFTTRFAGVKLHQWIPRMLVCGQERKEPYPQDEVASKTASKKSAKQAGSSASSSYSATSEASSKSSTASTKSSSASTKIEVKPATPPQETA